MERIYKGFIRYVALLMFTVIFFNVQAASTNEDVLLSLAGAEQSPTDFGAKGDGVTDDSEAFMKYLSYLKTTDTDVAYLSDRYIYNLGNKTIEIPKRIILKITNSRIRNAILKGNNTIIEAPPHLVFENVTLDGYFINTDQVYVEWFGTFPNESNSVDLKESLRSLNRVFFNVTLNQGTYYTKEGNIDLKSIKGQSQNMTFIELQSDTDGKHLFHIGKVGGSVAERTYEYNKLQSVGLVLSANKKIYNNTLLIVGAAHKADVKDVKFIMNSENTSLTSAELKKTAISGARSNLSNKAIAFNGASELISVHNVFTLSDVAVYFHTGADFITFSNLTTWCGKNGLASVYFKDSSVSNLLFTGAQSWSQGLYGVFAADGLTYNNFVNVKIENLRIEQLNTDVKSRDGSVLATSFWFGSYSHIPSLTFQNVMLAGTANGFRFGKLKDGVINLQNINVFHDPKIKRAFAMKGEFQREGYVSINLQNAYLAPDIPVAFVNAKRDSLPTMRANSFVNEKISTLR